MKAISLWQPWATAMALGVKTIETRSWFTRHRGDLLICAGTRKPQNWERELLTTVFGKEVELPLGRALCIVELYDCVPAHTVELILTGRGEHLLGDFTEGRYAWLTRNLRKLASFPVVGRQGLFNVDAEGLK